MILIGNAFSAGMLDENFDVSFRHVSEDWAKAWVRRVEWESCIGHADTAELVSEILGIEVPMRRVSTSLKDGDEMLISQYNGPRLPEGATSLPEGAKIRWIWVKVKAYK
jgi:hypothetical protein